MEPLASKIRPKNLKEFVGQEHLVGKGKPIAVAIEKKHLIDILMKKGKIKLKITINSRK